jgi:hypothetical protein
MAWKKPKEITLLYLTDCIIPQEYLSEVDNALKESYVDCYRSDRALW